MTQIDRMFLEKLLEKLNNNLIECKEKHEFFKSLVNYVNANPQDPNGETTMKLAAENKIELDLLNIQKKYIEERLTE